MKKIKASIRSLMSTVRKAYESTKKGLKSASYVRLKGWELFSYNVRSELCQMGKWIKRKMGIKSVTRSEDVPINFHGDKLSSINNKKIKYDGSNHKSNAKTYRSHQEPIPQSQLTRLYYSALQPLGRHLASVEDGLYNLPD